MNITDPIWAHAQSAPATVAIVADSQTVTYGQLRDGAELIAHNLAGAGIGQGDCVALSVGNPLLYLTMTLALARIGAIVLPLNRAWIGPMKEELLQRHAARAVIQDRDDTWRSEQSPSVSYLPTPLLVKAQETTGPSAVSPVTDAGHLPWMVRLTSGTTGTPKSVLQTQAQGAFHVSAIGGETSAARTLVFVDLQVGFGLANALRVLFDGKSLIVSGDLRPHNVFALVQKTRPQAVFMSTGSAAQVVALAEKSPDASARIFGDIGSVTVAGSAVSPGLRARFTRLVCKRLLVVFGASETGPIALALPEDADRAPGCAGRLHAWITAQAVDEQGQALPPGTAGALRFKSPMVAARYEGDAQASDKAFRDGWFHSGDVGTVDADGYLIVQGRMDDRLNIGGNKIDPIHVESVLQEHPDIVESALVGVDVGSGVTTPFAAVVTRAPVDGAALRQWCLGRIGEKAAAIKFVTVPTLPRNAGGKILRGDIARTIALALQQRAGKS